MSSSDTSDQRRWDLSRVTGSAPGATATAQVAAVCTGGGAAIHLAVASEHFAQWWLYGLFFLGAAVVQGGLAIATWVSRRGPLLWGGVAVNALILALWAVTRTTGLPFGPDAGQPEAVGVTDVVCGALELGAVLAALVTLRLLRQARGGTGLRPAGAVVVSVAALVLGASGVAVAAPGESSGGAMPAMGNDSGGVQGPAQGPHQGGPMTSGNGNAHEMSDLPDTSQATAQQTAAARTLLIQLEGDTAKYRDAAVANKAGFDVQAALNAWSKKHHGKLPGAIPELHVANQANRTDGRLLDPNAPETLIYHRAKDGAMTLIGVMFTAEKKAPPAAYRPFLRWHFHTACIAPGGRVVKPSGGDNGVNQTCPSGSRLRKSGYMTHVWFVSPDQLRYAYAMHPPVPQLRAAGVLS